jgi:hypothetical protein
MERNFKNENFEDFLKQNADHMRMRPKEEVWKNISKSINSRKRRYTIGLISFFLLVSLLGYIAIETSNTNSRPTTGVDKKAANTSSLQTITNPATSNSANSNFISSIINSKPWADKNRHTGLHLYRHFTTLQPHQNIVPEMFAFEGSIIDSDIEAEQKTPTPSVQPSENKPALLTIESLLNSYKARTSKKLSFQFTFTPTISYRKLSENKSYLRSAGANLPPNYPALYNDVNSQVTHKPDMGFELGYTAKYALTKRLNLRAGLQLNVNRYAIKTFKSSTEVATIRLNNSSRPDSLTTITNYNNYNGYQSNWLQNFYVQFSAPVGVEYIVKKSNNVNFGIATTLQPNYVVGDRAYIISSDYKNYSLVPSLTRKWNVATSFETFVGYSTGKLKWQVGPQVRYQLLSSFVDEYPVKENLFDFGLKVGISLNNQ